MIVTELLTAKITICKKLWEVYYMPNFRPILYPKHVYRGNLWDNSPLSPLCACMNDIVFLVLPCEFHVSSITPLCSVIVYT